jgi:hypothetical protein
MQNSQFELAVAIPRDGKSIRIREYGRNGVTYVEGKRGQTYSAIFRNNTPNRVMMILSVDGFDVIDGQPATAESRGYVVEGYASTEIKGWRTSTSEVCQFFFRDKQGSYSAVSTGETANCGVIECKVFAEKITVPVPVVYKEHHYHHYDRLLFSTGITSGGASLGVTGAVGPAGLAGITCCCNAPSASTTAQSPPEFSLGTGWGAAMTDCVGMTTFNKAYEVASLAVYYTSADALQRMGIVLDKEVAVTSLPQGFGGFCKPPKGIQ